MDKRKKIILSILKGIILVVLVWLIFIFIAFVIFNRESNTRLILLIWITVDILFYLFLFNKRYVDKVVNISAAVFLIVLIILYIIPVSYELPQEALALNKELSDKHEDKYEYAKDLFYKTEEKWTSPVRQYLLEPHKTFLMKSSNYFWKIEGYVPSNIQSQIYYAMLLESGRFTEDEVFFKQKWCANSPHGYIEIKHPNQIIYIDHWAVDYFNEYKFGQLAGTPCDWLMGEEFIP